MTCSTLGCVPAASFDAAIGKQQAFKQKSDQNEGKYSQFKLEHTVALSRLICG